MLTDQTITVTASQNNVVFLPPEKKPKDILEQVLGH